MISRFHTSNPRLCSTYIVTCDFIHCTLLRMHSMCLTSRANCLSGSAAMQLFCCYKNKKDLQQCSYFVAIKIKKKKKRIMIAKWVAHPCILKERLYPPPAQAKKCQCHSFRQQQQQKQEQQKGILNNTSTSMQCSNRELRFWTLPWRSTCTMSYFTSSLDRAWGACTKWCTRPQ